MLNPLELKELEKKLISLLPDRITEVLTRTNLNGELEELLRLLNCSFLLKSESRDEIYTSKYETYKEGKIIVVGGSKIKEEVLLAIGKELGIDKKRFEFCLDYAAAQKYDFRKMQYAPAYRVVLFGPIPHSGIGKGKSGSIIAEMENNDGYPRIERLLCGQELKITKSNFREKLQQLIEEGYI